MMRSSGRGGTVMRAEGIDDLVAVMVARLVAARTGAMKMQTTGTCPPAHGNTIYGGKKKTGKKR